MITIRGQNDCRKERNPDMIFFLAMYEQIGSEIERVQKHKG